MDKRFCELDKLLKKAKSICLISSRKITTDEIKSFLKDFLTLYSFEKVYYINIHSSTDKEKIVETQYNNITIYECFFNDVHPDGNDPKTNQKFWKGNIEYWDKILEKVSLNNKFVNNYRRHKIISGIFPKNMKLAVKVKCINLKCSVKRLFKIKA